jgi:hypothetical protein
MPRFSTQWLFALKPEEALRVPAGNLSKTRSCPVKPDLTSVLSFTVVPTRIGIFTRDNPSEGGANHGVVDIPLSDRDCTLSGHYLSASLGDIFGARSGFEEV